MCVGVDQEAQHDQHSTQATQAPARTGAGNLIHFGAIRPLPEGQVRKLAAPPRQHFWTTSTLENRPRLAHEPLTVLACAGQGLRSQGSVRRGANLRQSTGVCQIRKILSLVRPPIIVDHPWTIPKYRRRRPWFVANCEPQSMGKVSFSGLFVLSNSGCSLAWH